MKISILFFISCLSLLAYASESGDKNTKGIIDFELNKSLNKLSKQHIRCYKCEAGSYPMSVSQLLELEPVSGECKALFAKEVDFIDPSIASFLITKKEWDNRTTFVFTEDGVEFDNLSSVRNDNFLTMNILHSELGCALKK